MTGNSIQMKEVELKMFDLKMERHSIHSEGQMVEIWNGNIFIGSIYPTRKGIKVISKYISQYKVEAAIEIDRGKLSPIPAILINLV